MNLSDISQTFQSDFSDVQTALSQYVVAPLAAFGIGGLVFDIEGTTISNLTADITDHYAEDNTFLQDHMAIKPKRVTLRNYMGEVVYYGNGNSSPGLLSTVIQKLTTISSYLPTLSAGFSQASGIVSSISNGSFSFSSLTQPSFLEGASSLYAAAQNLLNNPTRQANAYSYFQALMNQKILTSIQTPYEFIANVMVDSLQAIQDEETKYMSSFQVTFKQMRFAPTKSTNFNSNTFYSGNQTPNDGQSSIQNNNTIGTDSVVNQSGQGLVTPVPAGGFQSLMNNPLLNTVSNYVGGSSAGADLNSALNYVGFTPNANSRGASGGS